MKPRKTEKPCPVSAAHGHEDWITTGWMVQRRATIEPAGAIRLIIPRTSEHGQYNCKNRPHLRMSRERINHPVYFVYTLLGSTKCQLCTVFGISVLACLV